MVLILFLPVSKFIHVVDQLILVAMYEISSSFLCGLHEVYSRTMLRPDLFLSFFLYLSTRDERLSRGLVSMAQLYSWFE